MDTNINDIKEEIQRQRYRAARRKNAIIITAIVAVIILLFVLFHEYHINYDEIPGGYVLYEYGGQVMYYDTKMEGQIRTTGNIDIIHEDLENGILYVTTETFFRINNFDRWFRSTEMKSIGDPTFGYGQNYKPDENFMIRHDDEGNEYKCTWYLVARYYCDRDGTRHRTWTREGYEEMVATAEQQ